nr:uncharacterized protein LOC115255276 [Aedes albopictus]
MPRVSKKRKAAILRCIQRKKRTMDEDRDQIRASVGPANPDLMEIGQPDGPNEDHYLDCFEMPSPCSSPGSYSEPDIILPPSQDGNETASSEQLHAYASSPADLRSMDYDEMSLPEMPFIGVSFAHHPSIAASSSLDLCRSAASRF